MEVIPHSDGGGPVVLLGAVQGMAQAVHVLGVLLCLGGEAEHLSALLYL